MKFDMIVSGVGGQGILSISFVVDNAALEDGFHFKQSEVHGMAQRGGAVYSHLRVSDETIYSDLVSLGGADLLLSMEPLETLRYLNYLNQEGTIVSSISPFVNIPNYPEVDELLAKLRTFENHTLVNGEGLARAAGSPYAQNMVMLGAACHLMPMDNKTLEKFIGVLFKVKGEKIIDVNINAFRYGALAGSFYRDLKAADLDLKDCTEIATQVMADNYGKDVIEAWTEISKKAGKEKLYNWMKERRGLLPGGINVLKSLLKLDFETATDEDFEESV